MRIIVDRIENNIAVCLFGDEETSVDIPIKYLPIETKEGSWVNVSFKLDMNGEQKQRDKISNLLDKLKNIIAPLLS